jgi:hypothetical protein
MRKLKKNRRHSKKDRNSQRKKNNWKMKACQRKREEVKLATEAMEKQHWKKERKKKNWKMQRKRQMCKYTHSMV